MDRHSIEYPIEEPGTVEEQLGALGITIQSCPPWCAGDDGDHFGPQSILYAEDGFFHYGPAITVTDDSASLGDGRDDIELTLGLACWVPTLAAPPGPARICLSDGHDGVYYVAPTTARWLAAELNRIADQASRD
jgi:uncharacterized protein DUF6907